jgi:hypothetical protein
MRLLPAALGVLLPLFAAGVASAAPRAKAPCLTATVQAAKAAARNNGGPALPIPPSHVGSVESGTYPLRVYYETAADEAMAGKVLAAAEQAWKHQVEGLGYPAPSTGDGSVSAPVPGLWIYVFNTGYGVGGYTEPLRGIPDTPQADCSSRVVVDSTSPDDAIGPIVEHEFNHATEGAVDCMESFSAWENFTTALEVHFFPDYESYGFLVTSFQSRPELALDYFPDDNEADAVLWDYPYGALMFPVYLKERFAAGDHKLLRQIWSAFAQPGNLTCTEWGACVSDQPNHPNWFEGTDAELKKLGSNFDEAFDEFSVWRAITGHRDDGKHYEHAGQYAEVKSIAKHSLATLPAQGTAEVHQYGSAYVELLPESHATPVRVSIVVDPEAAWSSSLLLGRKGQAVERLTLTFKGAQASLDTGALDGVDWAMLVVSQHANGPHDTDALDYDVQRTFTYSVTSQDAPDAAVPALDAGGPSSPAEVAVQEPGESGCSCGATPAQQSPWGASCALLAAIALRKRSRERKRNATHLTSAILLSVKRRVSERKFPHPPRFGVRRQGLLPPGEGRSVHGVQLG